MIRPRRFDGHAAQQRMIQIGSLQPRKIRCDLEEMLKDRERTSNQSRSQNSIADSEGALHSDHPPVIGRRIKPIDGSNQTKGQRQQPDGEADAEARADQLTTASHLQCEGDRRKSADQTCYQQLRVNGTEQHATPKTYKKCGVKPVMEIG